MCRSLEDGGRRCSGVGHEGHDAAWFAAKRARRREQYAVTHPSTGGHGVKPLPADAGPPKRRPSKLNLGAPMLVDMSRGLALGVAPEGHPSKEQLEVHNAGVRARWAVKATPKVVKAVKPTEDTSTPETPPASPTRFPVTVTRIAPKAQPVAPAAVAVGERELAALTKAETDQEQALEDFREAAAGDPTKDVRPLAERRTDPDGNPAANHPDGPAFNARYAKAKARLEAAKAATEDARTVHHASMKATWAAEAEAADAEAEAMAGWRRRRQAERDAATATA